MISGKMIKSIITRGYGSFGSPALILLRGYSEQVTHTISSLSLLDDRIRSVSVKSASRSTSAGDRARLIAHGSRTRSMSQEDRIRTLNAEL